MSALRTAVHRYLGLRRGLGFQLRQEGVWLERFAAFLKERQSPYITRALAVEWASLAQAQPSHIAHRLSVVRGFATYQAAHDPRTEVPALGLLPHRYQRKPPYIYTDDEIRRLLVAATRLHSKLGLRAQTYSTLLGLLTVTGMRIGETVNLDRNDVDLVNGVLTVRRTKFGKARLIPVHPTTVRALRQYGEAIDRHFRRARPASFFVGENGRRLTVNVAEKTFVKLSRKVGLRGPSDSWGPRLHDLRHRFAVNTLLRWYRAGRDVERHLPQLSTYLGHAHPTDTYWYLTAAPELMRLVAARLESDES